MSGSLSVISIDDIPALTQLYSSSALSADPDAVAAPRYGPSSALNDRISLVRADITTLQVDAIVNAANTRLRGGGGIDGAIHNVAGKGLLRELVARYPDGCNEGDAVLTGAHNLPSTYIIHTVGPKYNMNPPSESDRILRLAYANTLATAESNDCQHVAFNCVGTGIYGYPHLAAANVACDEVRKYLENDHTGTLKRVVFVIFMDVDMVAYKRTIPKYFPPA